MMTIFLFSMWPVLFIVCVLLFLALLYYVKHHGHHDLASDQEKLAKVLTAVFTEVKKPVISHNRLVKELKKRLHVGEKVAHILIGKAKALGLVDTDGQTVKPGANLGL